MIDLRELPGEVIDMLSDLRKEAAKFRHQRNGARREADALRAEVTNLRAELAELRQHQSR